MYGLEDLTLKAKSSAIRVRLLQISTVIKIIVNAMFVTHQLVRPHILQWRRVKSTRRNVCQRQIILKNLCSYCKEILSRSWEDWAKATLIPSVTSQAGSCRNACHSDILPNHMVATRCAIYQTPLWEHPQPTNLAPKVRLCLSSKTLLCFMCRPQKKRASGWTLLVLTLHSLHCPLQVACRCCSLKT